MEILVFAALVLLFNFPHFYGEAENRLFIEHGELLPGKHFKIYHLWLALLFGFTSFLVFAISGSLLLAVCYVVYAPFGLDWVWWVHRWLDFNVRISLSGFTIFLGRFEAQMSYHEKNAWHQRSDWDNYLGLPLVQVGPVWCYWWWPVVGGLSAILFALFMVI